jgi:predicted AlkP superfamily pyrophosphatase or phosphodiesterase
MSKAVNVSIASIPLVDVLIFIFKTCYLIQMSLAAIDLFARNLTQALGERNLTHIVDIIFVSDHGMMDTSHPTWIYVDEIVGQSWKGVTRVDGK